MENKKRIVTKSSILMGLLTLTFLSGCVVTERHDEGYWDHDHGRYWHDHGWVSCGPEDMHCR